MARVAGIIVNLVPYHHARWEAFTRAAGVECDVVELTNRDAFKVLEYSATASYRRHTLFPRNNSEPISARALLRTMAATLDTLRPEVVCVSGWSLPVSLAALAWSARAKVPVVMLSESNEFDEARSVLKEWIKRRIVGLCSAGLAGGHPQADYLAKLGMSRDAIALGYDVVDNAYFAAEAAKYRGQATGGSVTGQSDSTSKIQNSKFRIQNFPYFLACCRFGQKKNAPRLIEAYACYRQLARESRSAGVPPATDSSDVSPHSETMTDEQSPDLTKSHAPVVPWPLIVVGDGEMRCEIEATIDRCGVDRFVHLTGSKSYDEISAYYALAGAFIHASTTEQWGLVVNEAMACGLPVLVSNRCGCAQDLVQDGVNGYTFDPYDVEQLAQLMHRLTEAPKHRLSEMGDASRAIIADWGPERFASGLKQAVECALKVGPKRASLLQRMILKALLWR